MISLPERENTDVSARREWGWGRKELNMFNNSRYLQKVKMEVSAGSLKSESSLEMTLDWREKGCSAVTVGMKWV